MLAVRRLLPPLSNLRQGSGGKRNASPEPEPEPEQETRLLEAHGDQSPHTPPAGLLWNPSDPSPIGSFKRTASNMRSPKSGAERKPLEEGDEAGGASTGKITRREFFRRVWIAFGCLVLMGIAMLSYASRSHAASFLSSLKRHYHNQFISACPGSGWEHTPGDIPGHGRINGLGGGKSTPRVEDCRALCLAEPSCLSYEFDPTADKDQCSLNDNEIEPTAPPVSRQMFCRKEKWRRCAGEGETCKCNGEVRYGARYGFWTGQISITPTSYENYFFYAHSDGELLCNGRTFGGNPTAGLSNTQSSFGGPIELEDGTLRIFPHALPNECQCRQAIEKFEWCSRENDSCECGGMVRYGVDNRYKYKTVNWGEVSCSNHGFGEPRPGKSKSCWCQKQWRHCADQGGNCECLGTARFGENGKFKTKDVKGNIQCSKAGFGLDTTGLENLTEASCDCYGNPGNFDYAAPFKLCAEEGGTCTCNPKGLVKYGRDGVYVSKVVTGAISCTDLAMGKPETPTSAKKRCLCYVPPQVKNPPNEDLWEWGM